MNSDDEINFNNITRPRFEHLLDFLRKYESQDAYNHAIRLLVLGLLYNGAQEIIDSLSGNPDRNLLLSAQRNYAVEFQELLGAISSISNSNVSVTGGTDVNPSIQNFGIQGLVAGEINNHFELWKNSLEGTPRGLELAETIDLLEKELFSGFQDIPPVAPENFIMVPSTRLAHQLRMALATRTFTVSRANLWPRADLNDGSTVRVSALLQPQVARKKRVLPDHEEAILRDKMVQLVDRMTDLTVDVFDIMCNAFLKNGDSVGIDALTVEEFLEWRGLIKHKSGNGRRGGYHLEQRQAIDQHREILNNLYLISHYLKQDEGNAGSGSQSSSPWSECEDLFGMKNRPRQIALLSQQALRYDPYRQAWEKRLTRYLAWLWRIRKYADKFEEAITVEKLLVNAVGGSMDKKTRSGPKGV
jgi:hypothetical protein